MSITSELRDKLLSSFWLFVETKPNGILEHYASPTNYSIFHIMSNTLLTNFANQCFGWLSTHLCQTMPIIYSSSLDFKLVIIVTWFLTVLKVAPDFKVVHQGWAPFQQLNKNFAFCLFELLYMRGVKDHSVNEIIKLYLVDLTLVNHYVTLKVYKPYSHHPFTL